LKDTDGSEIDINIDRRNRTSIFAMGTVKALSNELQVLLLTSRLQRPLGVRHELSSLARMLGPWVRIPLEAWMSVCVYSVFVLGSGLATG
jgi:hypothetical protein